MNIDNLKSFFSVIGVHVDLSTPIDKGILGHGLKLIPLEITNNRNNYCHLYKDDKLVSKEIFRLGGLSSSFNKKPYCNLIYYGVSTSKLKDANKIESSGYHCIIDTNGKRVFTFENQFDSIYYLQGVIAIQKNVYYNLLTGKRIIESSSSIKSKDFLFVEHIYDWYNKGMPTGVYKIDWNTGKYEYFK